MDRIYFECAACVQADLQKYVNTAGVTVAQATTRTPADIASVICSNGDTVQWQTYLKTAARAWGLPTIGLALAKLKALIGLDVEKVDRRYRAQPNLNVLANKEAGTGKIKEYDKLDTQYFAQRANVLHDVNAYAEALQIAPINLTTADKHSSVIVKCANGEMIKWSNYLRFAAKAFGLEFFAETLRRLKKIIGLEVRYLDLDEVYFRCAACVHADLQKYASTAGISIAQATTRTPEVSAAVVCSNGDTVKWARYLINATKALGVESGKEALAQLKTLIGLEVKEYGKLDEKYFIERSNVVHDLNAYALAAGVNVERCSTRTPNVRLRVICSNGESVSWATYLLTAQRALHLDSISHAVVYLKNLALKPE